MDEPSQHSSRHQGPWPLDTHIILATYVGHPMSFVSKSLEQSSRVVEQSAKRAGESLLEEGLENYVKRYGIFVIPALEDQLRSAPDGKEDKEGWLLQNRCFHVLMRFSKGSFSAAAALERLIAPKAKLSQCACLSEDDKLVRSMWEMDLQFPKPSLRLARWSAACRSERFVESSLRAGFVLTRFGCISSDCHEDLRVCSWRVVPSHPIDSLATLANELSTKAALSIRLDECDPEVGEEFEVVLTIASGHVIAKLADILLAWRCLPHDQKLNHSVNMETRVHPLSIDFLIHVISSGGVKGEVHAKLWFA